MTTDLITYILKTLGDRADAVKDETVSPGFGDFASYRYNVGYYQAIEDAADIVQQCYKTWGSEPDDE